MIELSRVRIAEACAQTHALWGVPRSAAEHRRAVFEQVDRPERIVRYVGRVESGALVASLKRYALSLHVPHADRPVPAVGIGAFFTHPERRGSGVGAALLADVLDEARERGAQAAILYSEIDPSYYVKRGFVALAPIDHTCATTALPAAGALATRPLREAELFALHARARPRDQVRFARSRRMWRFFRWRGDVRGAYALLDRGHVVGYLLAGQNHPLRDLPIDPPGTLFVDEWRSLSRVPRTRVLATIRAIAEGEGLRRVHAWLPADQAGAPFVARKRVEPVAMIAPLADWRIDSTRTFLGSFEHF